MIDLIRSVIRSSIEGCKIAVNYGLGGVKSFCEILNVSDILITVVLRVSGCRNWVKLLAMKDIASFLMTVNSSKYNDRICFEWWVFYSNFHFSCSIWFPVCLVSWDCHCSTEVRIRTSTVSDGFVQAPQPRWKKCYYWVRECLGKTELAQHLLVHSHGRGWSIAVILLLDKPETFFRCWILIHIAEFGWAELVVNSEHWDCRLHNGFDELIELLWLFFKVCERSPGLNLL
jgi:hypothetical protein